MNTACSAPPALLAEIEPILPTGPGPGTELLILTAAGLILLVVLLLWVRFWVARKKKHKKRKRKRRHHHRHHHRTSASESSPRPEEANVPDASQPLEAPNPDASSAETNAGESEASSTHHRRRRMRKSHRPRFPTLAETGGLPPRRDTNPPSHTP